MTPSGAEERAILRGFGRASIESAWWRKRLLSLRHCPACGGPLARRLVAAEGRRRHVCVDCGAIAYQNPKLIAATLPVWKGKVVLLRRAIEPSLGLWTYPAGFMELEETVAQAAARETWEEIRARVTLEGAPRVYSYPDAAVVTLVYRARVTGAAPRPGQESQCVQAFAPSEIPWRELAFRSTYHALKDWVESLSISD